MEERSALHPLQTLPIPSASTRPYHSVNETEERRNNATPSNAIGGLCFIPSSPSFESVEVSDDTYGKAEQDENDSAVSPFASCGDILRNQENLGSSQAAHSAARLTLGGRKLASCHADGRVLVFDLGRGNVVKEFGLTNRRMGLCLRSLAHSSLSQTKFIMYQTRDELGTVTIHDPDREMDVVTTWETKSRTFCAAYPCLGDPNMIAMPSALDTFVSIRDCRVSPADKDACLFHAAGIDKSEQSRMCGMLSSLSMISRTDSRSSEGNPALVACGMENGMLFLHDLRMTGKHGVGKCFSSISLASDPILSVDLAPSSSTKSEESIVAIAGLAGDAAELETVAEQERGRVSLVKATLKEHDSDGLRWSLRQRARVGIGRDGKANKGKSGVPICRFRPDGRIFAAGGWDWRLRVYDRSGGASPLALLKGHTGSVDAMDWAPDASMSGLIATGGSDGMINIWRCFHST